MLVKLNSTHNFNIDRLKNQRLSSNSRPHSYACEFQWCLSIRPRAKKIGYIFHINLRTNQQLSK